MRLSFVFFFVTFCIVFLFFFFFVVCFFAFFVLFVFLVEVLFFFNEGQSRKIFFDIFILLEDL